VANPLALLDSTSVLDRDRSRSVETAMLGAVQRRLRVPGLVRAARGMSVFGEHAAGWLALGLVAAAADPDRRRDWLAAAGGVAAAHAASIAVKRVVRRPRPDDPSVAVLAGTPSRLSFPSAHASSTTAAAMLFGAVLGPAARRALPPALVPPMLLSRLVLGVHFPSDVLVGSALGAGVAAVTSRLTSRSRGGPSRRRGSDRRRGRTGAEPS
jgi:membrane-associated phospholipid phosphatase